MTKEHTTIPLTDEAIRLIEARGISPETATALGWQSLESRKGGVWICQPFLRDGKVVNRKYRTLGDKKQFYQDAGGEQCFYNLAAVEDIAKLSDDEQRQVQLVITEGEMDCAVALQNGYLAVSVPAGAPAEKVDNEDSKKFTFLDDLPRHCVVVLAVDDDAPGHILRQEIALRAGWHRCKWVRYPKGCKDLNDVQLKFGAKGVNMVLRDKAAFMNQGGLFTLDDLPAQPNMPAFECGIGNLSSMVKLRAPDLIVVTGIPSMGKTLLVNCMMCNMAMSYGWKICVGSFEQNPRGELLSYLRKYYLGAPPSYATDARLADADNWIREHFTFVMPDPNNDELITLKWTLERYRAAITQHGARLIVLDPWNELDHDRPHGMSLTEYVGFAIKELKRMAKQYMVPVIVVAHPAKPEKNKDGSYPVPTMYDISDSQHWYNKSEIGVAVHRLEGEPDGDGNKAWVTLVRVLKVRDWDVIGRIGDVFLEYNPHTGQYIDRPDFVPKKKYPPKNSAEKAVDAAVEKQQRNMFGQD